MDYSLTRLSHGLPPWLSSKESPEVQQMKKMCVRSLGGEDPLEEGMPIHPDCLLFLHAHTHTHTHTSIHSSPHTHWGLLDQTGAAAGTDLPSRIQTEWGQRVWLAQSPASGPGSPPLCVGVGAAGVVGSGSAPSLWEPGNKGPYSALAVAAPPCQGRLPSGKGTVGCWAVLPGRLSLWHGPQQGRRV